MRALAAAACLAFVAACGHGTAQGPEAPVASNGSQEALPGTTGTEDGATGADASSDAPAAGSDDPGAQGDSPGIATGEADEGGPLVVEGLVRSHDKKTVSMTIGEGSIIPELGITGTLYLSTGSEGTGGEEVDWIDFARVKVLASSLGGSSGATDDQGNVVQEPTMTKTVTFTIIEKHAAAKGAVKAKAKLAKGARARFVHDGSKPDLGLPG